MRGSKAQIQDSILFHSRIPAIFDFFPKADEGLCGLAAQPFFVMT
jgi:hypothetical protein